jgi:hypothetical protein
MAIYRPLANRGTGRSRPASGSSNKKLATAWYRSPDQSLNPRIHLDICRFVVADDRPASNNRGRFLDRFGQADAREFESLRPWASASIKCF